MCVRVRATGEPAAAFGILGNRSTTAARRVTLLHAFTLHAVDISNMNPNEDTQKCIRALIQSDPAGRIGLAAKLQVAESTVARWESGQSNPRPSVAAKIRDLSGSLRVEESTAPYTWLDNSSAEDIRSQIHATLTEIREALHKSGRLSSRQEALDEISKLLFAHVISVVNSGTGITHELPGAKTFPAKALRNFVCSIFTHHLPSSLAHELSIADFSLRMRESENQFAAELISAFASLDPKTIKETFSTPSGIDVLNEIFGQFLADSFVDEKELGQYLTPSEVVGFMTRLGLGSLPPPLLNQLLHPEQCKSVGHILDPSCGVGSFLTESIRVLHPQVIERHGSEEAHRWLENMLGSVVVGIDKSERMIRLSLTNLALFGTHSATLHFGSALARNGHDGEVARDLHNSVQLILTNPPFGASFSANDLSHYKIANDWCAKKPASVDSEILFMERYIDWLKPGGHLVTIVPDSILTNRGLFGDLREGLSRHIELRSVVSLPPVTFGAAGTTTKTSILHLVKRANGRTNKPVYVAVCKEIGYSVMTRSSHRRKVSNGTNELVGLLPEALGRDEMTLGRKVNIPPSSNRWDATFHVGLPEAIAERINSRTESNLFVRNVATLSNVRVNPARSTTSDSFEYIEISDVSSQTLDVTSKLTRCEEAPSRARKLVRAGDVLVSTVRPERKTIGIVPPHLDGSVCSTGFAVLKCHQIDPTVLALLLQSDFANEQILRNNIGIAYPAIPEECLLDVLLPISAGDVPELAKLGGALRTLKQQLFSEESILRDELKHAVNRWVV